MDSYSSEYRFSTWLFTIGYRVCLDQRRRRRTVGNDLDMAILPGEAGSAEGDAAQSEEAQRVREMIWRAVEQLSPPQRAAVLLFYRHEFGCQQIAQVLQLPAATVKSHLHRARAKLKELLEPATQTDWTQLRNSAAQAG